MGMRINYNAAASNAWRNLGVNDSQLAGSVEKLSSGLRINKGADDPAGLIISQRLQAQIAGLGQAVQNAQEATSLVQTAEGALTEMNSMLVKMRSLAVHSANAGVNDADTIAADQRQVDSALDSLQKIAQNTKYQAKLLLDGSASNTASYDTSTWSPSISSIDISGSTTNMTGTVDVAVTTEAERATVEGIGFDAAHEAATITVNSSDYDEIEIAIASNATAAEMATSINQFYDQTGVWAATNGGEVNFTFSAYGDSHDITISANTGNVLASAGADSLYDAGVDADGTMSVTISGTATTLDMTGDGLELTVDAGEEALVGSKLTLIGADQTTATDAEREGTGVNKGGNDTAIAYSDLFSVTEGALSFSLGQDAGANEIRTLSIANMQIEEMGTGVSGLSGSSLNSLRTGGTYALANDAANAVQIIDEAIDDVSIARATLGAFQQNALETTISTLSINKENLEASNSRIADVDMASEMMTFTKNQILVQAGTAMLAQANQLPQSVLQLLG